MANFAPLIRFKETNEAGVPLVGGKLWTYIAGTTTPLATYSDVDNTPNTNPVILDSFGEADVLLGASSYKFLLTDSLDNLVWERDNISIPQVENGFSTGDIKFALKTVADSGWVLMDDKSIGSAGSGATGRANSDTQALFLLLWANVSNAYAPVSGGRGATAAADWAADKRLTLPKSLGRTLATYGSGSGLTSRSLGEYLGEENHILTEAELATHTHIQDTHNHTQNAHGHNAKNAQGSVVAPTSGQGFAALDALQSGYSTNVGTGVPYIEATTAVNQTTVATNQSTGSSTAHNNMQPTLFVNTMIKL